MTTINQKEYLKKYLSIGSEPGKKKKRKKKSTAADRVKIIDDDIDIATFNQAVEEDLHGLNEDAPQIVGIIDERPLEMRIDDYRKNDLWKPLGSQSTNTEIGNSRRKKAFDDCSPPRKRANSSDNSSLRESRNQTGDMSPRRKQRRSSDASSPRRSRRDSDRSPVRRNKDGDSSPARKSRRDNDISPVRRSRWNNDSSPVRKAGADNDTSPTRKFRRDSDNSPVRKNTVDRDSSPIRRNRRNSDTSPPRRSERGSDRISTRRHDSPRRNKYENDGWHRGGRGMPRYDDRRYQRERYSNRSGETSRRYRNDSPARRSKYHRDESPHRRDRRDHNRDSKEESTSKSSSGMPRASRWDKDTPVAALLEDNPIVKMYQARKSGLKRANEFMLQNDFFKKNEEFLPSAVTETPAQPNVAPIVRDRKTGKIRDFGKEAEEAQKKQEKEDEIKAKYDKWGRGLKQVEDATEKLNTDLHEMSKPLARYADDEDLEKHLKEIERDGDPMLAYLRKKRKKNDVEEGKPVKPQFEGEFMPNRYGIRPGHRWDGVDRSNGYEKKWFEVMNSRRAQQEEAYKWSTEDM